MVMFGTSDDSMAGLDFTQPRGNVCAARINLLQNNNSVNSMIKDDARSEFQQYRACRGLKRSRTKSTIISVSMTIPTVCVATIWLLSTGAVRGVESYITAPSMRRRMRYLPIATQYIKSTSLAVSIAENAGSLFEEENVSPMFDKTCRTLQTLKNQLKDHIYRNRFVEAMYVIQKLLQTYSEVAMSLSKPEQRDMCSEIDASIQEFLLVAFTTPLHQDYRRVLIGMDVMHLQLSKSLLCPPFNTIPRRILLNAIAAITSLPNEVTNYTSNSEQQQLTLSRSTYVTMSYRFLQRLISRVGVRGTTQYSLTEKEFNQVLHAHCKIGHMTSAERIVKLQERTIRQTPISLVTFSILLKGYGQNNDLSNVERTIQRAKERYSTMDTIMINTIIDAYINCNAIEQAELFFSEIKRENAPINRRTYNTYMKGLAKQGELGKAIDLALEMKHKKLWDSITTNTLVHTSIIAGNVTYAEEILEKETMRSDKYRDRHPNVEAYTELLDTYSKANQLDRSLSVLQTMQRRNVEPNEVTYTCLMGGLGRNHRIDLAHKILTYMETRGQRPTTKMYNALFSGLLYETNSQGVDSRVDDGMKLLVHMKQTNVQPNSITVSIIVDALGRCTIPRVVEAQMLVDEFVRSGCISKSDNRVLTSLLNIYGRVGNFEGVMSTFQNVERPDTVAVNAFIDACCRCGREKLAIDAFELYFRTSKNNGQRPDVVTYAILIGSILKRSSTEALRQVRLLYADMKNNHKIFPDSGLIDVILKSMIRIGSTGQLTKQHAMLITDVLQDAERLHWEEEQLNRRKRAIRATILESFGNTLRPNDPIFDIVPPLQPDNDLFSRKGWNQVHSGFRLWGPPVSSITSNDKAWNQGDDFLNSHGWNDVDSKFRVI